MLNLLSEETTKFEDFAFEPIVPTRYFVRGIAGVSLGACCEDDGEGGFICEDLSESVCVEISGDFKGVGTACSDEPDPCMSGACCLTDEFSNKFCEQRSESSCSGSGGNFQGEGTTCDPDPCVGICCCVDSDGFVSCDTAGEELCVSGEDFTCEWIPDETTCFHNPLCGGGACCFEDASCYIYIDEESCLAAGGVSFAGDGVMCAEDGSCPERTGACCRDDHTCDIATQTDCEMSGTYQGDDTNCEESNCPIYRHVLYEWTLVSAEGCPSGDADFGSGSTTACYLGHSTIPISFSTTFTQHNCPDVNNPSGTDYDCANAYLLGADCSIDIFTCGYFALFCTPSGADDCSCSGVSGRLTVTQTTTWSDVPC